jgi:hypothetical protein
LRREAERIQSSGVLGETRLRRLFDYLVTASLAEQSPKEIAIAIDVFDKGADFDAMQDAAVRVYIHKLRKALDGYYAAHTPPDGTALQIPRGEYRVRLVALEPEAIVLEKRRPPFRVSIPVVVASVSTVLALGFAIALFGSSSLTELGRIRGQPVWSALLRDDRPIVIVVGDYYLIGETDDSMEVKRLIREYSVNSKSDLDNYIQQHPEVADRYMDVGLRYLPIAVAFALRDVMVVLAPENRRIRVVKESDLEANSLKSADIVYIGYLSGLGKMQDLVLTGSRFRVGESFDEFIDTQSKHTYVSQTASQILGPPTLSGRQISYHDYGFITEFRGPGGNAILVISGTRDEGVQQAADAVTSLDKLQELRLRVETKRPFEALLEVSAFDGVNLSGRFLLTSNRE